MGRGQAFGERTKPAAAVAAGIKLRVSGARRPLISGMEKNNSFWLDLFTWETWNEFLEHGGKTSGFRESRWSTVQKIVSGDILLCYLTGVSRFIGALEVVGEPFVDKSPIWRSDVFPARLPVKVLIQLKAETAIPVYDLRDQLSFFQQSPDSPAWTGYFRGSPNRFKEADGNAIFDALEKAQANPRILPVDPKKLQKKTKAQVFVTKAERTVTIPEETESAKTEGVEDATEHTKIQALLLRLGKEMAFDTWVARNDKSKEFDGKLLGGFPGVRNVLPLQFDQPTNKTIELIDVLWLKGNSIVAAFEIESTTSIYSGLLRMADLIAMQPNMNIPLYIVAPDKRREKVITEINRPIFSRLEPGLNEICRFLSFSSVEQLFKKFGSDVRFLKAQILEEISEDCALSDAT
jgi:hypothetical protein